MFHAIATVYLLLNGQPIGEPLKSVNSHPFTSLAECTEFVASDIGKAALDRLNADMVASLPTGGSHTVTTSCVGTDGTI